ncbi:MAG: hypothetical protein LBP22_11930 [Deltaproteobacteria bacterium]|jgi:hypothetical protein|nr:hypothetical protein [Deltaproteobacteria bacterium]
MSGENSPLLLNMTGFRLNTSDGCRFRFQGAAGQKAKFGLKHSRRKKISTDNQVSSSRRSKP